MTKCDCDDLPQIQAFRYFDEFKTALNFFSRVNVFAEIEVKKKKHSIGLTEKCFKCRLCGRTWRLVFPDAPFGGEMEEVI